MKCILFISQLMLINLCFAEELQDRADIHRTSFNLYQTNQHELLISLIDGYLLQEKRTGSGVWFHSLTFRGISDTFNLETTLESYWDQQLQKSLQLTEKYPHSPVFYLIHADGLIRKAMMYLVNKERSDKNDNKVHFEPAMETAFNYMEQIKSRAASDPRWYELMLMIAKEQNWPKEKFNLLISEAMNKYPYYYEIYFKAVKYLTMSSSDWNEELEIFIDRVVENTFEKEKTALYARIHWYVLRGCNCLESSRNKKVYLFERSPLDWQKMMAAIDDVLAQYSDQWNINHFAFFACHAGDYVGTKKLLDQIIEEPIYQVWQDSGLFQACKEWADNSHLFLNGTK